MIFGGHPGAEARSTVIDGQYPRPARIQKTREKGPSRRAFLPFRRAFFPECLPPSKGDFSKKIWYSLASPTGS